MKNQYVGDIGDYGKYGMLRFLAEHGIKIGVNWYLTKNDGSKDGKHITYLDNAKERIYDPIVYDALKELANRPDKTVHMVESADIIPGAFYYHALLATGDLPWKQRRQERERWHGQAMEELREVRLVFADPDNGTIGNKRPEDKGAEKYVLQEELADYYRRGQNIVYYCQRGRWTEAKWKAKRAEMHELLPDAKICVLTFHRGTQRAYVFVVHPEEYERYYDLLTEFVNTAWGTAGKKKAFEFEDIII